MFVMNRELVADGALKLDGAAVSATANLAGGELGKPARDLIEPASRGRGEMYLKACMPIEPAPHRGGLVRAVVVYHEMYIQRLGQVVFEALEEPQNSLAR